MNMDISKKAGAKVSLYKQLELKKAKTTMKLAMDKAKIQMSRPNSSKEKEQVKSKRVKKQ